MSKFQYSILQYHHSAALSEALNIGILFSFPSVKKLHFTQGDSHRLKSVYSDVSTSDINQFIKIIQNRVRQSSAKIKFGSSNEVLLKQIHENILSEDASALQFITPINAFSESGDVNEIIEQYSNLFLPGLGKKEEIKKHDENYIISHFNSLISANGGQSLTDHFQKNVVVKRKFVEVKFDYVYENGSINYIKSLSFDLQEPQSIQNKAAANFAYLDQLKDYKPKKGKEIRFDFLIAKPQSHALLKPYNNAIQLIEAAKANKQLLTEEKWDTYSRQTVLDLREHIKEELKEDNPNNELF